MLVRYSSHLQLAQYFVTSKTFLSPLLFPLPSRYTEPKYWSTCSLISHQSTVFPQSLRGNRLTPPLVPTIPEDLFPRAPTASTNTHALTKHPARFPRGMTSSYTWPLSFRSEGWFKLWLHCPWFMAPSLAPFKVLGCSLQSLQT